MADWHLRHLEGALAAKGWRIISVQTGDGYRISGSWQVQRSSRQPGILLVAGYWNLWRHEFPLEQLQRLDRLIAGRKVRQRHR